MAFVDTINPIDTSFLMLCSLLVLLMTPSLAMFYAGMVKSKNTLNTIMNCCNFFAMDCNWI